MEDQGYIPASDPDSTFKVPKHLEFFKYTGGPRIVRILGHQGIVLLQKLY